MSIPALPRGVPDTDLNRLANIVHSVSLRLLRRVRVVDAIAGLSGVGETFGGMAVAGLPFFLLWIIGSGGAGDAKMMFAIGAWLGIENGFIAAVSVGVAGGILSLVYALGHGRLLNSLANTMWMTLTLPFVLLGPGGIQERQKLVPPTAEKLKTPYSVAMLAGTCAAALWVWSCAA